MTREIGKAPAARRHLLTVAVEDDFHAAALSPLLGRREWRRLESRVLDNTVASLELLDRYGARATFFVLGWVAERVPEVVQEIVRRGHEPASKGFLHRTAQSMDRDELGRDALRAKQAIEVAGGVEVHGHRIARGTLGLQDLWVLDVLAECGFVYDSSLFPRLRSIRGAPWRRFPHVHHSGEHEIHEFPISTWGSDALLLPLSGGNAFRQLPRWVSQAVLADWTRRYASPFNMYFHVWELDPEVPRIARAGWLQRLRRYRNVDSMGDRIAGLLADHHFIGIGDLLDLPRVAVEPPEAPTSIALSRFRRVLPCPDRLAVTLVVPCFEEEAVLSYLAHVLKDTEAELGDRYAFAYVFVDDGSSDGTFERLRELFGDWPDCQLLRHERNQGVAAAILTGIRASRTEVVASIDCDCSYDPSQLEQMIPLLEHDTVLVTASPYHPEGRVIGVPAWRLVLSRGLTFLYRLVLPDCPTTVTSCFRVYRRSVLIDLQLRDGGFLGVAETLALLCLRGERVVEHPAVLESRLLGESKMKLLRTIGAHLRLLARLVQHRIGLER